MKATLPPAGEPSIAAEVSNYKVSFPTDGTVPTDGRHDRRCDGDDNGKDIIVMWVWEEIPVSRRYMTPLSVGKQVVNLVLKIDLINFYKLITPT